MSEPNRKIALVTGMGVVSPYGIGAGLLWDGLVSGTDAVGELSRFPLEGYRVTRGGQFKGDVDELVDCPSGDLATRFLLTAADEALTQAQLTPHVDGAAIALVVASNFAQIEQAEKLTAQLAQGTPLDEVALQAFGTESAAVQLRRRFGLNGVVSMLSLSCASGNAAIGAGLELIRHAHADIVLVGAYDAITQYAWSGLIALRTMTSGKIRPFDATRDGTTFGEGAACLVLESVESAERRNVVALAEVAGYATNNNAFHLTAPEKNGKSIACAMALALLDAGVTSDEVDTVNAHGTATRYNDVTETAAIKQVLGERSRQIPVNSIKSMIGHLCGAASAVEAVATVQTLRTGIVPPTIHYETPDPECDLDCVPNTAREYPMRVALNSASGLGGCNSMVVFRKVRGS